MGKGRKWTAGDVRRMLVNPIYAGVGPFPALVTDEQWIGAVANLARQEGAIKTLRTLRRVVRETFPEGVDAVADVRFAEVGAGRIKKVGLEAYLTDLLAQLRTELRDVSADRTVAGLGEDDAGDLPFPLGN